MPVCPAGPAGPSAAGTPAAPVASTPGDPWENWNRKVFAFNEGLDEKVLKPVATVYSNVVPQPVRRSVDNFFGNFSDAWSAVNLFLQGRFKNGATQTMRVAVNSVFGLAGLIELGAPVEELTVVVNDHVDALRRRIDPEGTLDLGSKSALSRLRELLAEVKPLRVNFGALAIETSTAMRQLTAGVLRREGFEPERDPEVLGKIFLRPFAETHCLDRAKLVALVL